MKHKEDIDFRLQAVEQTESNLFSELVSVSGLNPKTDFRYAHLADVNFTGSDLSDFNFDYADLRGATWTDRKSNPSSIRYALRGSGNDQVRGEDFEDIKAIALSRKTWKERFFAFKTLVDNWGVNDDTLNVLTQLVKEQKGTYLRLCSLLYFSASYRNEPDEKKFCEKMAIASNSQTNVFRLGKLRQSIRDQVEYFNRYSLEDRYPNTLSREDFQRVYSHLNLNKEYF